MATKGDAVEKRVKDPVSEMRIFTVGVKKEKQREMIYQNFQLNQPRKINFQTDKPNNNPFLLMKLKQQGRTLNGVDLDEKLDNDLKKTVLTDELNEKLKTVTQVPKQKWSEPQTSSQQVGWFAENYKPENSKFIHKRQSCSQTHYADNYYTMKHVSLFSNNKQK